MLYLLHGTDTARSRKKLSTLIEGLLAKRPDALLVRIEGEQYDPAFLEAQIGGQGLFAPRSIVVLDSVLQKTDAREHFCTFLSDIAGSENVFVCVEGVVEKDTLSLFEKHAQKVEEHTVQKVEKDDFGFIFSFTDAFGERRKKDAWLLFEKAKRRGYAVEELHHKAFWQVKNMLLALSAKTPEEAGMKAFPFSKAKKAGAKWTEAELKNISDTLVSMNHESRRGRADLALSFEYLLLSL